MIVAVTNADVGEVLVIGLSRKDIIELKRGLTKTKHGGRAWKFAQMLVFMKDTDQECIELLKQAGSITDATTWDNDQQMGQG